MSTAPKPLARTRPARLPRAGAALARLLDAAPVGMVVADFTGRICYANRAFGELLGHHWTDELVLNVLDLVDSENVDAAWLHFDRLARGETRHYRGEHRWRHADGSLLWVMVAATLLEDPPGAPRQLIVQLTSIELQKRAEEALAYSESRWNFALESARQGVWDHDIRKDTMFYSRMWRLMRE